MEGVSKVNNDRELSHGTGSGKRYVRIKRSKALAELVKCPICLGFLRNTRTVMECLHRFCKECIEKALRNKKECPTCGIHCSSRRAMRDDLGFDTLIAALYPDLDNLEKDKHAFLQESLATNREFQRSIEETFRLQCEVIERDQAARTSAKVNRQNAVPGGIRKKVGRPPRVTRLRSPRASTEREDGRRNDREIDQSNNCKTPPTLNAGGALADHEALTAAMILNEIWLAYGGGPAAGEIGPTKATATVSRSTRADDGGVLNGTGKKPMLPDLNEAVPWPLELAGPEFDGGSCSPIVVATTSTQVYPPWEGGVELFGLHLLCDTATEAASRRIEEAAAAAEGTQIKETDIRIPQQATAAGGGPKKRRRVLILPRHDSDSSSAEIRNQ